MCMFKQNRCSVSSVHEPEDNMMYKTEDNAVQHVSEISGKTKGGILLPNTLDGKAC